MKETQDKFKARWFNPQTGKWVDGSFLRGGSAVDFVAPDNSDWILLVQVSSEPKIRSSIKGERVMNGGVVKIVWQIGFANNSFTEFGLAPNDARRFKKVFGERMEFVFGETPLSRFPFIQATPTRLEEGNLKCLSSSAFNSRTNPKVFTHCTSHWQTPNEICHSLFTQKFVGGLCRAWTLSHADEI